MKFKGCIIGGVLAVIVGVISEIFVYGKELQDEMNQIA